MDTNFTWSINERGEKAILYNNYLYGFRRENQNGTIIYVCTFKSCSRAITLKNNAIIKLNGVNHNHDSKLPENVQTVLTGLKRRVLNEADQPVAKIYEEEVKKFIQDKDFDAYQKVLRAVSHRYINVIKDVGDSSDEE